MGEMRNVCKILLGKPENLESRGINGRILLE
jgi:hypothetical protein